MKLAKWPEYSTQEANAAKEILLSGDVNYWTGSRGKKFEREF